MRQIPLSNSDRFLKVDNADYEYITQNKWRLNKDGYPSRSKGITVEGKRIYSLLFVHNEIIGKAPKGLCIDHINRDKLDNRRKNLRIVTFSQNQVNSVRKSKTGYKGVIKVKGSKNFGIQMVCLDGIRRGKSGFHSKEEAALAYNDWVDLYQGGYGYKNKVPALDAAIAVVERV